MRHDHLIVNQQNLIDQLWPLVYLNIALEGSVQIGEAAAPTALGSYTNEQQQ